MRQIVLAILTVATLMAADATGTWTGTLTPSPGEAGPAHLVLKQEGNKVTGTAGPNAGEQHTITNGKAEDGNVTFELQTGESTMRFSLKQEGDEIKGDVTRDREGQKHTATLAVKREK